MAAALQRGDRARDPDPAPWLLVHRRFDEVTGQLNAGLFFICFQRDPAQFETIQRNLSGDLLNEYIVHTSSAVFAVPPGIELGGYVGEALLT